MESLKLPARHGRIYAGMLVSCPLIAVVVPRFMGLAPSLAAIIGLVLFYATHKKFPAISRLGLVWALVFPVLMALSALWGIDPETSFTRAYKTLPIVLSAPVLWSLAKTLDNSAVSLFRKFFPVAVGIAAAICIIELYAGAPLYQFIHDVMNYEKKFRLSQLNRSIVVIMLSGLAAVSCFNDKKNLHKFLFALLLAVVLAATKSQSAQLGFILAAVAYIAFPYKQSWGWPVVAAALALFMLATPWLTQFMFHKIAADIGDVKFLSKSYANQRLEIWDFVSRRALEKPVLGHGAEAARVIKDFDNAKLFWPTTQVLHPHNFAVQIWLEFAALGTITVSLFFGDMLRQMRNLKPAAARAVFPLFVASLSVATTGYGLWQSWWLGMFCLLFAYGAILVRVKSENAEQL